MLGLVGQLHLSRNFTSERHEGGANAFGIPAHKLLKVLVNNRWWNAAASSEPSDLSQWLYRFLP